MARMTTTYTSIAGLNRALRKLPKETTAKLRDAAQDIASDIATKAQSRAKAEGGVAALVAPTIRAGRDRVPLVRMGSSAKLPESGPGWERDREGDRQTIGDVMWGAEFGAIRWLQFKEWRGNDTGAGYFLFPTVRGESDEIMEHYSEALLNALEGVR